VFELYADGNEAQIGALAAGGRYDYLMETIGGHLTPAMGGAAGAERLIAVMRAKEIAVGGKSSKRVFLAHAGALAKKKAFAILKDLRGRGFLVAESLSKESLAAQLKVADKEGIALALILGQKEIYENSIIVRDLTNGLQEAVPLEKLAEEIKKRQK
jgi:histidyl-tRNA synthetase